MTVKNKRVTIGLMVSWLQSDAEIDIWTHLADLAEEQDVNLLLAVGANPNSPFPTHHYRPSVYDLLNNEIIDGLILSGPILTFLQPEGCAKFVAKYKGLPMVSVLQEVAGIPSIFVDNKQGTYDEIMHLIRDHGYRRIAYLSGPRSNQESNVRYAAYLQALQDHGIPFDERLVVEGDFDYKFGETAVDILRGRTNLAFDVLVCANDGMALGAMPHLARYGCTIPDKMALVGFDDVPAARYLNPPLTTVRQPFPEITEKAFSTILALIAGEKVEAKVSLPGRLLIRQSCGCLSYSVSQIGSTVNLEKIGAGKAEPLPAIAPLAAEIISGLALPDKKRDLLGTWLINYLSLIYRYLADELADRDILCAITDSLMVKMGDMYDEHFWQQLATDIRNTLLCRISDSVLTEKLKILFQKINVYIAELILRPNAYKTINSLFEYYFLRDTTTTIMSTFDFSRLIELITEKLQELGIGSFYMIEYQGKAIALSELEYYIPEKASSVLVLCDGKILSRSGENLVFPTRMLVPEASLPAGRHTLVLMPLIFNAIAFGYVIFELRSRQSSLYESLRAIIANALSGAYNVEELKRTKAIAESASRIKSEFLANMSHEIRTPMNSILGFANLLLEEERDEEKIDKLKTISQAGKSLLNIINDVLDFSKIEAGAMDLHNDPFSLKEFFKHLEKMFSFKAEEKKLAFDVLVGLSIPEFVFGDEQRLSQVAINLLSNAFKFTESGGIEVRGEYKQQQLFIKVRDTGIGIAKDKHDLLFQPFSQVDASTTRKFGGTGLGLAISKQLVKRMNGDIYFESEPGKGSTFIVQLPLKQAAGAKDEAEKPAAAMQTGSAGEGLFDFDKFAQLGLVYRILIAEDEELNRKYIGSLLSKSNLDFDFAENGQVALQLLEKQPYDLLLLDMQMPVIDGLQVIAVIRRHPLLKTLPVIAVTAHALKGDEQKYLDAGCDYYISKPIDADVMRARIAELIMAKHVQAQKLMQTVKPDASLPLVENGAFVLDARGREQLKGVIRDLQKNLRVFDDDLVRQAADRLLQIPEPAIELYKQRLHEIADLYDAAALGVIIAELERLVR